VNCKGCKFRRFNFMSWLIGRHDKRRLYERCTHPEVVKQQGGGKFCFCNVGWMWPCTDGKLKEAK